MAYLEEKRGFDKKGRTEEDRTEAEKPLGQEADRS